MIPFVRDYLLKEFAQNRTRDAITACTTIQGGEYYTTVTYEECKINKTKKTTKQQKIKFHQWYKLRLPVLLLHNCYLSFYFKPNGREFANSANSF